MKARKRIANLVLLLGVMVILEAFGWYAWTHPQLTQTEVFRAKWPRLIGGFALMMASVWIRAGGLARWAERLRSSSGSYTIRYKGREYPLRE